MNWESVIGIEIHAQLKTKSKLFCSDSTHFKAFENENTSPISLGMPGTLPMINKQSVFCAIKAGLALGCRIRHKSVFSRKNYFYPDLPKGYQISQSSEPLCEKGEVEFLSQGELMKVSIERAHMEEDAGKSQHQGHQTLLNFNRAGNPLLEIVSYPDLRTPEQASEYCRTVCNILKTVDVCDGNLEEGSLRCDCNVSVRKKGETKLGTKVELKNINSFRFIYKAISYEITRQIDVLNSGGQMVQETRLYDSTKNKTFSMRRKEEAHDYRYFPDPDLLPLEVSEKWIETIRKNLPELPLQRALRFQKEYKIPEYDAHLLNQEKEIADFFEQVAQKSKEPKLSSNWIMGDMLQKLKEEKKSVNDMKITSDQLSHMIKLICNKTISGKIAKTVFSEMWGTDKMPEVIVKEKNLVQITDETVIEELVNKIISSHPEQLKEYRRGKTKIFGFFVGQSMKASKGQVNPEILNQILKKNLDS